MSSYKDYINQIFNQKSVVIKDMFATLFLDFSQSIEGVVEVHDPIFIDELKGYPDTLDFNIVLQRFSWQHFSNDHISNALNASKLIKFSAGDLKKIFRKLENLNNPNRSRLKSNFEGRYRIQRMDEWANTADQLTYWRNINSHEGIRNSGQAMAIYAQLSVFIKSFPDSLKNKINGLAEFKDFLDQVFLKSILEVIDPDLTDQASVISKNDESSEDIDDEIILNLEIDEIKNSISKIETQSTSTASYLSHLQLNINQISTAINQINLFLNSNHVPEKTSINPVKEVVKTEQVQSPAVNEAKNNEILEEKTSIETDDPIVERAEPEVVLTDDEILDKLLELRYEIYSIMSKRHRDFEHWHNICQKSINKEIASQKPQTKDDLRSLEIYQHYYESKQIPQRQIDALSAADLDFKLERAKVLMDEQLDEFWPQIEFIIQKTKSQVQFDSYDARRIALHLGLVDFPQTNKNISLQEVSEKIAFRNDSCKYLDIFQIGLEEALNEGQAISARERLVQYSSIYEEDFEKESIFQQFRDLVDNSVNRTRVEGHALDHGHKSFSRKESLRIFFDFDEEDFKDWNFGKHGWEKTPMLSPFKQSIHEGLNHFRGLSLDATLDLLESFCSKP